MFHESCADDDAEVRVIWLRAERIQSIEGVQSVQ